MDEVCLLDASKQAKTVCKFKSRDSEGIIVSLPNGTEEEFKIL